MSDLPVRREKVVFPNPGISPEQWFLNGRSSLLTRSAPLLPIAGAIIFATIVFVFCLTHNIPVFTLSYADVFLGLAFWPGFIIGAGVETLIASRANKKKELYRREHVQLMIDMLASQGWVVDSKNPADTLVEEDHPYLYSEKNSFRYKTYQRAIKAKVIEWTFELSDDKAERIFREDAKQKKIALMTAQYEKEHGVLSPEKKATFQNALKLTL